MPRPGPPPADLLRQALAATSAAARRPVLRALAAAVGDDPARVAALTAAFLDAKLRGKRAFLEWVALLRPPLPPAVRQQVRPLLADRRLTPGVRANAAAALLRSVPDEPASVRPVTKALTAGLPGLRALERLRQLQNRLDRSAALDELIERKERRVKLDCPRCGVRLPRPDMVRHLWAGHRLLLVRGKVRSVGRLTRELRNTPVALRDPDRLDRAAALAGTVSGAEAEAVLRKWLDETDPKPAALAPLLADAADRRAGLCPGCLSELPAPFPPLPPPLETGPGRVAGDGYAVEVFLTPLLHTQSILTPTGPLRDLAAPPRPLPPRGAAALFAAPFAALALLAAVAVPSRVLPPLPAAFGLLAAAAVAYGGIRLFRRQPPDADALAIDAAWGTLVRLSPGGDDPAARRFLTRLCRTSLGRGDPAERAASLRGLADRAGQNHAPTADVWQLHAAARVLQVDDGGRLGRDRVAGIAELVAEAFDRRLPLSVAEYALDAFLNRPAPPTSGEIARLRSLLHAAAFDAGLTPRTLLDLWPLLPNLRRATAVEPAHRLGLIFGMWSLRGRPWEPIAAADTAFELARNAPNLSGRLLTSAPDLLLAQRPEAVGDDLYPILVCCRGVQVAGQMVADPNAEVDARKTEGGYELMLGPHRVTVRRKPTERYLATVRGWLRFRAEVLLRFLDVYRTPAPGVFERLVAPLCVTCPRCETRAAVAVGRVGVEVVGGSR